MFVKYSGTVGMKQSVSCLDVCKVFLTRLEELLCCPRNMFEITQKKRSTGNVSAACLKQQMSVVSSRRTIAGLTFLQCCPIPAVRCCRSCLELKNES